MHTLRTLAVVIAVAMIAVLPSKAYADDQIGYVIWDTWWTAGFVPDYAAKNDFFDEEVTILKISDAGQQFAALNSGQARASNSIERVFGCSIVGGDDCVLTSVLSTGHNYVLIGPQGRGLYMVGSVENVLRDVSISVSLCEPGLYVTERQHAIINQETSRNTATGILIAYVVDKNQELNAAGEAPVAFFCGTREMYREAVSAGTVPDHGENVVYGVQLGASGKRYAGMKDGVTDLAVVAAPFHLRAQTEGYAVILNSDQFRPFPESGIVMMASFYETERGEELADMFCRGMQRAVEDIKKRRLVPEFRTALANELYISLDKYGEMYEPAIDEMIDRIVTNMGGCTADPEVMADYGVYVGGVENLRIADRALSRSN